MSTQHIVNHLIDYHQVSPYATPKAAPSWSSYIFPVPHACNHVSIAHPVSVVTGDASQVMKFVKAEREEQRQTNAAVLGGFATLILAGVTACTIKHMMADTKELREAKRMLREQAFDSQNLTVKRILQKHIEILSAKCVRAKQITALVVSLLACATAGFVGGMFAISGLVTAATVGAVATGALAVFAIVWHYDEPTELPPSMQRELRVLGSVP